LNYLEIIAGLQLVVIGRLWGGMDTTGYAFMPTVSKSGVDLIPGFSGRT